MTSLAYPIRAILMAALFFSLPGCMYYYQYFGIRSDTFSQREIGIIDRTTQAIQFDYGYDDGLDVDYFFPLPNSMAALKNNEAKFIKAIDDIDNNTLVAFYEKVWQNHEKAVLQKEYFGARKKWKEYTYVSKYLLPGIEEYTLLLEKYIVKRDPDYGSRIAVRKAAIRGRVNQDLQNKRDMKKFQHYETVLRQRK